MRTSRPASGRWEGGAAVATLATLLLLGVLAGPAAAVPVERVVDELGKARVYVDPEAGVGISQSALLGPVEGADTPIYIAVLSASSVQENGGTLTEASSPAG